MVVEDGSFTQRYVYAADGKRLSVELSYADGTARATNSAGEYGENIASDIAVNDITKVRYRSSLLDSSLFAVDANGDVITHVIYDVWGLALTETTPDLRFAESKEQYISKQEYLEPVNNILTRAAQDSSIMR